MGKKTIERPIKLSWSLKQDVSGMHWYYITYYLIFEPFYNKMMVWREIKECHVGLGHRLAQLDYPNLTKQQEGPQLGKPELRARALKGVNNRPGHAAIPPCNGNHHSNLYKHILISLKQVCKFCLKPTQRFELKSNLSIRAPFLCLQISLLSTPLSVNSTQLARSHFTIFSSIFSNKN